ncbi:hypothetical protein PC129_g24900 [Phytophthora cactorum]|uniref:ABM domain-containing protein n=2 Tax=Phytophthora cactorum TaxID=29920 RepID=A0A8T1GUM0_9STRA|nr:hypothetical protein C6341_g28021 [Phytophthora cactorum]KAG3194719.1 hypothetical protein PC129_g24900 [Phytophthora cactorum]
MVFTIIVNLYAKDGVEDQLRAKLAEAAQTYSKDAGVLGWYPMQNVSDSRKWTIVERYDQESVRILSLLSFDSALLRTRRQCRWPCRA